MNFNLGDCTIRRYTSNLGRKFFIFGWMKGFVPKNEVEYKIYCCGHRITHHGKRNAFLV